MLIDVYKAIVLSPDDAAKEAENNPTWYNSTVQEAVAVGKVYNLETGEVTYNGYETPGCTLMLKKTVKRLRDHPEDVFRVIFMNRYTYDYLDREWL